MSDAERLDAIQNLMEESVDCEVVIARRRDGQVWVSAEKLPEGSAAFSGKDLRAAVDAKIASDALHRVV